jgi:hypothetical protein
LAKVATQTRHNRTITVDFHDEPTYAHLLDDGKAFLEWVLAFILSIGFQLAHQGSCKGGGCMTRHSHYIRIRLDGITIWRIQCTTCKAVFTVLVWSKTQARLDSRGYDPAIPRPVACLLPILSRILNAK